MGPRALQQAELLGAALDAARPAPAGGKQERSRSGEATSAKQRLQGWASEGAGGAAVTGAGQEIRYFAGLPSLTDRFIMPDAKLVQVGDVPLMNLLQINSTAF